MYKTVKLITACGGSANKLIKYLLWPHVPMIRGQETGGGQMLRPGEGQYPAWTPAPWSLEPGRWPHWSILLSGNGDKAMVTLTTELPEHYHLQSYDRDINLWLHPTTIITFHVDTMHAIRKDYIYYLYIVKLREREGQGVDQGRSLKGHLWMVDGGYPFPDALH